MPTPARRRRRPTVVAVVLLLLAALAVPAAAVYDPPVPLSEGALADDAEVLSLAIAPDGSRAVFYVTRDAPAPNELWSVALDGGTPAPVQLQVPVDPTFFGARFSITPDSANVVTIGSDPDPALHVVPIDGSAVSQPIAVPTAGGGVTQMEVTPDGAEAVLRGDLETVGVVELWAVPLDGSADPRRLSAPNPPDGGQVISFVLTPSGDRAVFRGDVRTDTVTELHSVPVDGSSNPTTLHSTPVSGGDVQSGFEVTSDGTTVVYRGDIDTNDTTELYAVPVDGSASPLRLNDPPGEDGDVTSFRVSDDGQRVVYLGDLTTNGRFDLHARAVDRSDDEVRLNEVISVFIPGFPPFVLEGVGTYDITPDGERVVFLANGDLWTTSSGFGAARRLDVHDGEDRAVTTFEVSPDSSRVVYQGDLTVDQQLDVYSRRIDRSEDQVRLSTVPAASGIVLPPRISPDGTRVLYQGQRGATANDLYSRAIDGSGSTERLNDPSGGGFGILFSAFAPDSSFVVYNGDDRDVEQRELFASGRGQLPPPAPTEADVSGVGDDAAIISWTPVPAGSSVTAYRVTVEPTVGGTGPTVDVPADEATALVTGLTPTTQYDATVVALNEAGASTAAEVSFTTTEATPLDPQDVAVTAITETSALVSWTAPGPGVATYRVTVVSEGGHVVADDVAVPPDETSFALSGLAPGVTHTASVRAIALDGEVSGAVAAPPFATDGDPVPPPTDLTVSNVKDVEATLTWKAPPATAGPLDGFRVEIASPGVATLSYPPQPPETTTSAYTGLEPAAPQVATVFALRGNRRSDGVSAAFTTKALVRRAGANRYATAALTATGAFPDGGEVDTVFVATGESFPDALAGAPRAATEAAPILLTPREQLLPEVRAELERLAPTSVVLLGGAAAVSEQVALELAAIAPVERISGADRFDTAAAISDAFAPGGTVYLATGANFPDALAGAAAAGRDGRPILLATSDVLPGPTQAALERLAPDAVVVLGGAAAIGDGVLAAVEQVTGVTPTRIAGPDRYATAAAVVATFDASDTVYVATGANFPDALAAGPIAGIEGAPIALTPRDDLPDVVVDELDRLGPERIVVLGGSAAVSEALDETLTNLLG